MDNKKAKAGEKNKRKIFIAGIIFIVSLVSLLIIGYANHDGLSDTVGIIFIISVIVYVASLMTLTNLGISYWKTRRQG
jgi:ABC-type transport system involved in multi-copper enzyme maturation permease subunit